jgi:hypothetical protein
MTRKILTYGLISGAIVSIVMLISIHFCHESGNYEGSMLVGYATQLLAFSLIFFGVRNYRDKESNGIITFGTALKMSLLITLIASTMYVISWAIYYNFFAPDFMEKYSEMILKRLSDEGATAQKLAETTKEMQGYKDMYKNPISFALITYVEIIPVGILVSLIASLILRKKPIA